MTVKTPRLRAHNITLIDIGDIEQLWRDWRELHKTDPPDVINRIGQISQPKPAITIRCCEFFALEERRQHRDSGRVASITFPAVNYDGRNWLVYQGRRSGKIEHFSIRENSAWVSVKSRWWPKSLRDFLAVIKDAVIQSQKRS
ncbi:MAG: hypothetical protein V1807_03055 [Patescibacteria group bacterium]